MSEKRGTRRPPLWLAVHECAHAITSLVTDEMPPCPGSFLRGVSVLPDAESLGRSLKPRRVIPQRYPLDQVPSAQQADAIQHAKYDLIDTLAGPMAEAWQRVGAVAPYFQRDGLIREAVAAETKHGDSDDLLAIRRILTWLAPADPAAELKNLWHTAMAILTGEWPGIVAMAHVLRDAGEIDGFEFKDRWNKVRPDASTRARRVKRRRLALPIWGAP